MMPIWDFFLIFAAVFHKLTKYKYEDSDFTRLSQSKW